MHGRAVPEQPAAERHAAGPSAPEQAGPPGPPASGVSPEVTSLDPPSFPRTPEVPAAPHGAQPPASSWAPSSPAGEGPAAPVIGGFPETTPERPGPAEPALAQPPGDMAVAHPPQEAPGQWGGPAAPEGAPAKAPESAPVADRPAVSPDALVRRKAHGDSALRRVAHGVRKAVGASAAGDLRETTGMAQRLQSPVPSCRRIAVTSIRGGAGKTTVAALLATVIAEHRDDRVLAMDADSGLGSLPLRLGVQPERAMHDLAGAHPRSWEETAQYLAQTSQGLWVMSGSAHGQVTELELETFQAAAAGVSRYFSAAVIDCGAGIVARLQRGVLAAAHAQVFVAPGTVDGALSARQTLSWFVGSGYEALLSRTVVALVTHSPHADGDADLERARQVLSDGGLPVVVVPYDRHLATGSAITLDRVSGTARAAASWIAAEAFARSLTGGAL